MYQGIGIDNVIVCLDCGSVVADGWQPEHTRFHEALAELVPAAPTP